MMAAMDVTDPPDPPTGERPAKAPWTALAVLFALLVGLAAVGVALSREEPGTAPAPLRLVLGRGAADAMEPAIYPPPAPPEYRLDTALPDLGGSAPVHRVTAARFDEGDVERMARALGLDGAPLRDPDGWSVAGAGLALRVSEDAGAWVVSAFPAGTGGSVPGSPGAVGGSGPPDEPVPADKPVSSGVEEPVGEPIGEPVGEPVGEPIGGQGDGTVPSVGGGGRDTAVPPDEPVASEDGSAAGDLDALRPEALPGPAEAEAIARELLDGMGVLDGGEWTVAVAGSGVASASVGCPEGIADCVPGPGETIVTQRIVTFTRLVDGRRADGLEWIVQVGDRGAIEGVSGVLADLELVGAYPLIPTTAAYDALVAGDTAGGGVVAMTAQETTGVAEIDGAIGEPQTAPAPVVVSVTGVELAATTLPGVLDGAPATYLVPVYAFTTVVEGTVGGEPGRALVLALDPSVVQVTLPVGPMPPVGGPEPLPAEPPPSPVEPAPLPIEPAPFPGEPEPVPSPGGPGSAPPGASPGVPDSGG